jgi:hypothetical protein
MDDLNAVERENTLRLFLNRKPDLLLQEYEGIKPLRYAEARNNGSAEILRAFEKSNSGQSR